MEIEKKTCTFIKRFYSMIFDISKIDKIKSHQKFEFNIQVKVLSSTSKFYPCFLVDQLYLHYKSLIGLIVDFAKGKVEFKDRKIVLGIFGYFLSKVKIIFQKCNIVGKCSYLSSFLE